MPVEIQITKEIGNFEPKFIGPFTVRQCVCLALAAPFCILIYYGAKPYASMDIITFLCMFPAGIAALFGWVRPYGMKTEQFLKSVFINMVLAPNKRKYKIENFYDVVTSEKFIAQSQMSAEELQEAQKKEQKQERRNSRRKKKKKKYKLAKEAVK